MNEEKIKEYLNQTDKLEEKLEGKDKETLQWLIFGYNECARLLYEKEQENQQLKEQLEKASQLLQVLHYKFDDNDSIHNDIEEIQKILKDKESEINE